MVKGDGTAGTRVPTSAAAEAAAGQFDVVVVVSSGHQPPTISLNVYHSHTSCRHVMTSGHPRGRVRVEGGLLRLPRKSRPGDCGVGTTRARRPEHASYTRSCPSEPLDDDWPKKPHIKKKEKSPLLNDNNNKKICYGRVI